MLHIKVRYLFYIFTAVMNIPFLPYSIILSENRRKEEHTLVINVYCIIDLTYSLDITVRISNV